jgi:hypothetical protein
MEGPVALSPPDPSDLAKKPEQAGTSGTPLILLVFFMFRL